jgi:cephalosporin-C deacetylase-like acetyl esterase
MVIDVPETSIFELPQMMRAFRWTLDLMWRDVSKLNLLELAPVLQVPVFFLLGRRDHWVPPEVSVAYFDALTAPSKRLVWFEESGHEPFVDEAAQFNRVMVDLVRPAVTQADNRAIAGTTQYRQQSERVPLSTLSETPRRRSVAAVE